MAEKKQLFRCILCCIWLLLHKRLKKTHKHTHTQEMKEIKQTYHNSTSKKDIVIIILYKFIDQ